MANFIINAIFWVFALYGFFEFIKAIINICEYTKLKADGVYVIIAVKNQENIIEGFLRSVLFKIFYGKEDYIKNIMLVDLNSKDKTKEIIKKMALDYDCLKTLNWKECKEIIDGIEKIEKDVETVKKL